MLVERGERTLSDLNVNHSHSHSGQISFKPFRFYLDIPSKGEEKPVLFYLFSLVAKPAWVDTDIQKLDSPGLLLLRDGA